MMGVNSLLRKMPIYTVFLWLLLFALLPVALMLVISFLQPDLLHLVRFHFSLSNYAQLFSDVFVRILWRSFIFAMSCTVFTLLIGYPAAYFLSEVHSRYKSLLLLLLIIPFWTSSLIRTYAIMAIVKTKGLFNTLLLSLHLIHQPILILYSNTATMIGMVYNLLPFMILPLYSNFEKLDHRLFEAARDLGASRWETFTRVTLPLTLPGIMAGTLFVFLPAMTLFYVPDLLGGAKTVLMGNLVENQFLTMNDWPGGSATSIMLTVILLLLMWGYRRLMRRLNAEDVL